MEVSKDNINYDYCVSFYLQEGYYEYYNWDWYVERGNWGENGKVYHPLEDTFNNIFNAVFAKNSSEILEVKILCA